MSLNLNKVQLAGRVGKDAESYTFGGGTKKVSISLATNKRVKDANGEWKEEAQWHDVEVWGKTTEYAETVKKGDEIYVEGTVEYKEYTTKQGDKRKSTVITAFDVKVISRRNAEAAAPKPQQEAKPTPVEETPAQEEFDPLPF